MKMKICYIAPIVPGPEHTQRWVRYFADRGHEVHLILSSDKLSNVGLEDVQLHVLKRLGPRIRIVNYLINSISLLIQFKRLVKDINPDIIHAQQISDLTLLGAVDGFHPFIATPWGSDVLIAPKESKISKYIVKYVLKKADLITCDAEHIKEPLLELGAGSQKIRLIYFGVDTQKFNQKQRDEKLLKGLEISGLPIIISLRSFKPIYDIESLIASIPLVL
ncbi:MAG: glycosyltransferase, partial [Methanophagales archaeon]|nr:glycosyltransferase [Methanophagales archaeon]